MPGNSDEEVRGADRVLEGPGRNANLARALNPRSVALVGASDDEAKWGHVILVNLLKGGYKGKIYPINPRHDTIEGLQVFRSIADLPEVPDLAIIAVPAKSVAGVVDECAAKGIAGGLLVAAGFAEAGEEGILLERQIVASARSRGMLLIGPNSNGVMSPHLDFHSTLAGMFTTPGTFGVLSQSGNIAQWLAVNVEQRGFGVSHYISTGNEGDLDLADYLAYFESDPNTSVILSYVEGFGRGRKLVEVARRLTLKKPVVLLKAGVTPMGAMAASSHTAALAGSDAVVDAMCRHTGIIRVRNLEDMVEVGVTLASQPLPRGNRVGVMTAAGGYGVILADELSNAGLELAELGEPTLRALDRYLPPHWPRRNPVDKSGLVGAGTDVQILASMLESDDVDGVVTLGVPIGRQKTSVDTRLEEFQSFLQQANRLRDDYAKPVLAVPTWSLLNPVIAPKMTTLNRGAATATYSALTGVANAYSALSKYASHVRRRTKELANS